MTNTEIRPEKIQLVNDIGQLLSSSEALFLVSYKGLNVSDFDELRNELAKLESECHVVPNRLFKRAAAENQMDILAEYPLTGDSALITGGSDFAAVAKSIKKFAGAHPALKVKIGTVDNTVLNPEDVEQLATLPSREILLAQLLGVLQAPARNTVGVMYNRLAGIVYALNAYYQQKI